MTRRDQLRRRYFSRDAEAVRGLVAVSEGRFAVKSEDWAPTGRRGTDQTRERPTPGGHHASLRSALTVGVKSLDGV